MDELFSISTLFELPFAMLPDERLIGFRDRSSTYSEVRVRSSRLASALHRLEVGPGTGVAIMSTNHPVWLEAFLATTRIGAHLVGLNYRAKEEELKGMLRQGDVGVAFVEPRYLDLVTSAQRGLDLSPVRVIRIDESGAPGSYEHLIADSRTPDACPPADRQPTHESTALMLFTSGSTAQPKPVRITHRDVCVYITTFVDLPDLTRPREVSLVSAPLYHIAGFFSMLTSAYCGRSLIMLPQFERGAWLAAVAEHGVTHAFVVPTMLKQLLDDPTFHEFDLSTLTRISYGAAPMPRDVIEQALVLLPAVDFSNAYGQTETFGTVTVLEPADHRIEGSPEAIQAKRKRLGSVGRAVPGVRIKVCSDDGSELPAGEVGEVYVGRVSSLDLESSTVREWTRTGDLGYLDGDGYLFLGARLNDLIIRGGENVAPAEIESVLFAHPGVDDAAVVGVPDEEWGEAIVAFVVRRAEVEVQEDELIEWVRERVASYKKPSAIRFVAEIPRNATGKNDRRALLRLAGQPVEGMTAAAKTGRAGRESGDPEREAL